MGSQKSSGRKRTGTMKKLLHTASLSLFARVVLGVLFLYASMDKLGDPAVFAQSIGNYKILPANFSIAAATILPWLELLCGVSLLLGFFTKGSSLILTVLLFLFTLAVISALLRSLDISCGCFTQDPGAQKIGWMKVVENTVLLLLSIYLFFSTSENFSIDDYQRRAKHSILN